VRESQDTLPTEFAAHHDHHSKPYDLFINGVPFRWDHDYINPQQICELAGQGSDYEALQAPHGHEPQTVLERGKEVYLGNQHVHHFVTRETLRSND
jgi:hypothetical protein